MTFPKGIILEEVKCGKFSFPPDTTVLASGSTQVTVRLPRRINPGMFTNQRLFVDF